jgi:hypothetical protein
MVQTLQTRSGIPDCNICLSFGILTNSGTYFRDGKRSCILRLLCPLTLFISSSFSSIGGIKCQLVSFDRQPDSGAVCMKTRVFGRCSLFIPRPIILFALLAILFSAPNSWSTYAVAADQKVDVLKEAPQGLSAEVAAAIGQTGFRVTGKDGVTCDVWLAKEIPQKPKFKSSLRIKYPFQTGSLIGVIRYPEGSSPTDFRGQGLKPGTYTLRYGLQPDDGNHLGTSDIRDFLVGSSPDQDTSPKRVEDIKDLFKLSTSASGSTHPAIFLLIPPPDKAFDGPTVEHDDARQLVIFGANANTKDGDKSVPVPLSIVVVGKTEG